MLKIAGYVLTLIVSFALMVGFEQPTYPIGHLSSLMTSAFVLAAVMFIPVNRVYISKIQEVEERDGAFVVIAVIAFLFGLALASVIGILAAVSTLHFVIGMLGLWSAMVILLEFGASDFAKSKRIDY